MSTTSQPVTDADDIEWKPFASDIYRALSASMVHFSAKTANSNAAPAGVRLTADNALTLPYLSVRTLFGAGRSVPTDYVKNVGNVATVTKQLRFALAAAPLVPAEEGRAVAATHHEVSATRIEIGTEAVSPRLRQVLIPKPDAEGGYVALSPLSAAGTATLINAYVKAHNEKYRDKTEKAFALAHRRIPTATLGIGGSNPQNVGSLVRDLQTLVVATAPREQPGLRAAFALFHRGPELRLHAGLMKQFAGWRHARRDQGTRSNASDRDAEAEQLKTLARMALDAARKQYGLLRTWQKSLPIQKNDGDELSLFAADVKPLMKGIAEPQWRGADWPREMARHVVELIATYRFLDGTAARGAGGEVFEGLEGAVLGLDGADRASAVGHIEETLWNY